MSETPARPGGGAGPAHDPSERGARGELNDDRYVGAQDLTDWRTRIGRDTASIVHRLARRIGPYLALIVILVVGLVVILALSKLTAEIYEAVRENDDVAALDGPALSFALSIRTPFWEQAVTYYTDLAGQVGMPVIAVIAIVVFVVKRRSWTPVILIVAAGTGSLLMTLAGKRLVGRTRPPLIDAVPPYEYTASFPSGHSLNALVVIGIVAYLLILRRHSVTARVAIIVTAVVLAASIGLSRVYLGHHWLTDVLAGWTLGIAWLALVITAHRLYLTARHRGPDSTRAPRAGGGSDAAAVGAD